MERDHHGRTLHDDGASAASPSAARTSAAAHRTLGALLQDGEGGDGETYRQRLVDALSNYADASTVANDLMTQLLREIEQQSQQPPPPAPLDDETLFAQLNLAIRANLEGTGAAAPSQGVTQEFLDGLDRIPKKSLKAEDDCPICATRFLDDAYPLVVRLPCNARHRFDLECIAPWLALHATCPLCRVDFSKKKAPVVVPDDDEEEDYDDFYN